MTLQDSSHKHSCRVINKMDYEIPVNKIAKFRAILAEEPVGGKPLETKDWRFTLLCAARLQHTCYSISSLLL